MSSALDQLAQDLASVGFVAGTETTPDHEATLAHARRLLEVKLRFEAVRGEDAPPVVVVAGGTNVGKSTVFNWVVGDAISSSSPLARHTKAPTVFVHEQDVAALHDGALLPSYRRVASQDPMDATQEPGERTSYFLRIHALDTVKGVVLVDCPDIDSTHANNRLVAEDLLFLADAVAFIATPEKYNDELCVRYLRQATRLGKTLVCVLNKGADDQVARDFREVVVPGLGGEPTVLTLPYVPRPDPKAGEWRAALRAAVLRPAGKDPGALRRSARRGAALVLSDDLARIGSRLREELSELDRIRSEVGLVLDARRDEYLVFLRDLDFFELDRVFERVLDYFKIPVVDTIYDGFRGAIGFVSSGLSQVFTGRDARDSRRVKVEARAEQDRQRIKALIDKARAEALEMPYRHTGTLRSSAASWIEGLASTSVDEQNLEVQVFLERSEAQSERWIEAQTRMHVELLEKHPYARNALRAVKGVFQVGFGLLSAKLTGGFGPWDVLIGTATERATKAILEKAGGVVHYQGLKAEFTAERARLFREHLERAVAEPMRQQLPRGVEPDRLERLDAAAAMLRQGEL